MTASVNSTTPPSGVYFAALLSRLLSTCEAARIAEDPHGCRRKSHAQTVLGVIDRGQASFDSASNHVSQVDQLRREDDFAGRDSRQVEKLVDELDHQRHLTFHHADKIYRFARIPRVLGQDVQPCANRSQWVAQLMSQRGKELVLPAIGFLQPPLDQFLPMELVANAVLLGAIA